MDIRKWFLHAVGFAVWPLLLFAVPLSGATSEPQPIFNFISFLVSAVIFSVIVFAVSCIGYIFRLFPKRLRKIIWILTALGMLLFAILVTVLLIEGDDNSGNLIQLTAESVIVLIYGLFAPIILHSLAIGRNVSKWFVGRVIMYIGLAELAAVNVILIIVSGNTGYLIGAIFLLAVLGVCAYFDTVEKTKIKIDVTSLGKVNLHTHTTFCDGKNTAEEMAEAAFNAGYDILGFSGHTPCAPANLISDSWGTKADDMPAYIAEVKRLKEEYSGRMEVLCGVEWDTFSDIPSSDFDYVIGSVHGLEKDGKIYWIDISKEHFEEMLEAFGSAEELVKKYYKEYKKLAKKQFVDIVGHFDLIALWNKGNRYFDEEAAWYVATAIDAANAVIANGKIIEINSNAVFKGLRNEPYPATHLLEHIRSKGGKTVDSLDAHSVERFI